MCVCVCVCVCESGACDMCLHHLYPYAHPNANPNPPRPPQTVNDTWTPTHEYTKLQPNFDGVDPDDAFSKIPYEKGAAQLNTTSYNTRQHKQCTVTQHARHRNSTYTDALETHTQASPPLTLPL